VKGERSPAHRWRSTPRAPLARSRRSPANIARSRAKGSGATVESRIAQDLDASGREDRALPRLSGPRRGTASGGLGGVALPRTTKARYWRELSEYRYGGFEPRFPPVRGRRPSPLDDSGEGRAEVAAARRAGLKPRAASLPSRTGSSHAPVSGRHRCQLAGGAGRHAQGCRREPLTATITVPRGCGGKLVDAPAFQVAVSASSWRFEVLSSASSTEPPLRRGSLFGSGSLCTRE